MFRMLPIAQLLSKIPIVKFLKVVELEGHIANAGFKIIKKMPLCHSLVASILSAKNNLEVRSTGIKTRFKTIRNCTVM